MTTPCRLVLIDPHRAFRGALAVALEREPDITVIGDAGTIAEARPILATLTADLPNIVLSELDLPDGRPPDLLSGNPSPNYILIGLTSSQDRNEHARVIAGGVGGIALKIDPLDKLVATIRAVANGDSAQPAAELIALLRLANQAQDQHDDAKRALQRLTPREVEILQALATGRSDKEIALDMQISTNTVAAHIVHILRKLQLHSRLQAVLLGVKYGLITL